MSEKRLFFACLATVVLAGCGAVSSPDEVEPQFELSAGWHHQIDEGEAFDAGWCADFGSPELGELVEAVLEHNLDLRIAATRIETARALLRQSRAGHLPRVGLLFDAEYEREVGVWDQEYELSAPVSYEVDLWGRVRAQVAAARTELEAAELDLQAARLALTAETAENYFELARLRSELRLIDEQISIAETFLELTRVRHSQGMANAIDVVQQQQQIESLREAHRRARLNETLVLNALATLLGQPPGDFTRVDALELPTVVPVMADFVPADLLERRPDVRAARLRVVAADHRVDAALAERLPRIVLSARIGAQAENIQSLFEYLYVIATGAVTQTLWEGGRIRARIDQQRSQQEEQLLRFSATLLRAVREVEDVLARSQAFDEILQIQHLQLEAAREALDLAREQYRAGILDYLRVLTALQSVQRLELAELASRRVLLSQRIQFCRASGGYWSRPEAGKEGS